jgi:hypothetical protein
LETIKSIFPIGQNSNQQVFMSKEDQNNIEEVEHIIVEIKEFEGANFLETTKSCSILIRIFKKLIFSKD